MRIRRTVAILIAVCGAIAPGRADDRPTPLGAQAAIPLALAWVEAHSRYKSVPPIRFWVALTADQMAAQAIKFNAAGDFRRVMAAYACTEHTMYLRSDADYNDAGTMSYLIHETVHHAQCEDHQRLGTCDTEREAYRIQAAYFRSLPVALSALGRPPGEAQRQAIENAAVSIEKTADLACAALKTR